MIYRSTVSALLFTTIGLASYATGADNILETKSKAWKFKDNVEGVADDWTSVEFDDTQWQTGTAPLGYGDDDTDGKTEGKLTFGDNPDDKRMVAFLRHALNVADPSLFKKVHGKFVCDDGCVIYINGKEVHRFNLPAGKITNKSKAGFAMGGDLERYEMSFLVDPKLFQPGKNVIAVRLHQANPNSSDLALDVSLKPLTDEAEVEAVEATIAEEKAAIESIGSGG